MSCLRHLTPIIALFLAGCGLRGPLEMPPGPPPEPILGWPGGKPPAIPLENPMGPGIELVKPQQDRSGEASTPGIEFSR